MIAPALEHSASHFGIDLVSDWLPSVRVDDKVIRNTNGVFIAPGAPSEDIEGILMAIRLVRTQGIPCLGTCGGFQRIVMEYALHKLKFDYIEHEEISPDAVDPFFSRLKRSLAGEMAVVLLEPGSVASECYGGSRTTERFACSYGLNRHYVDQLSRGGLKVSGVDAHGEARVVELGEHPFFLATLFVPQLRSTASEPHPIITAFVNAGVKNAAMKAKQPNKSVLQPTTGTVTRRAIEIKTASQNSRGGMPRASENCG